MDCLETQKYLAVILRKIVGLGRNEGLDNIPDAMKEAAGSLHGKRGSNSRHSVLETDALPTELFPCLRLQK